MMEPQGLGAGMAEQPEAESNVTPEEQAEYEAFVRNGLKIIYPEGEGEGTVSPQILQSLKGSEQPVINLATTTVALVRGLTDSARKANHPIPDDILFHGSVALLEELAEIADAAKIYDYSEDDIEHALYAGLDMFREQATADGSMDGEALKAQFGEVVQADKDGTLDELLPGIGERMKGAA